VLEHDVLDLACRAATLDVLSGGRFLLGVGAGWLREELANHRRDVPFEHRYGALVERVSALRACWEADEAEFEGRWDRFSRSMVYPKPIRGRVPVGFGCSGQLGMRLAARHADGWLPIDVALQRVGGVEVAIGRFRQLVEAAGRDPASVPITLFVWGWEPGNPDPQRLTEYAGLDIERIVVCPPSLARHDSETTLRRLDEFTPFVAAIHAI
jgi:alkanesulfonate monooxygenase SsuD/methylene tetrahydromethanopterin reductase-like flavin-dependent oxidoreductase (luciferase family)